MKDRGRESFRPNLVYKTKQRLQLAWQTPRSIEEQVRRGLFADHNLFAVSVFFFQHSSVQLLKRTTEIEKQILELWADSERRTANNMVSNFGQRFMFAKLPRWLPAGREKVDAKS